METDQAMPLEELSREDLLEQLEGGLFALITEDKKYEQLVQMAVALGLKDFVQNTYRDATADELVEVFFNGETTLSRFIAFAGKRGLIDFEDE